MLRQFSKKWFFLLVVILADLYIALNSSILFFYFIFWLLITVSAMNCAWIVSSYFASRLSITRKVANKAEEDDEIDIELTMNNRGIVPCYNLVVEDVLACSDEGTRNRRTVVEFLGAKQQRTIRYRCRCFKRGKYALGPCSVYFFDPLGLFFLKKTFFVHSELFVYPRTFPIKNFPPLVKGSSPWFGIEAGRSSGDDHEFHGVREYRSGDPIKRIHWFSSARKNRIIVKEFQRQSFYRATIMFNLDKNTNYGSGKETVVEYIIKIAASVAKNLLEKDVSVALLAHVGEMMHFDFNKGHEHLEDVMRFLALAQAESRVSLGDIFDEFVKCIPHDSSIIAVMLDTDWGVLPRMMSLGQKNISVIPLVVHSTTFLQKFDRQKVMRDISAKFVHAYKIQPLFFSQGDNLEAAFG